MSTNGQITFIADGHAKRSYNHWDSNPSALGLEVLRWLRGTIRDGNETLLRTAIKDLVVVSDFGGHPPTEEQERELEPYTVSAVGGPNERWYRLLRKTQGDPGKILSVGYAYDQNWGVEVDEYYNYIVNCDVREFICLGHIWSFDALPDDDVFALDLGGDYN